MLNTQISCCHFGAVYIYTHQLVSKQYWNKSPTIIKKMLTLIPEWSNNQSKQHKTMWKIIPCWSQLRDWFPLWRLVFGTSGGYPWTDFGLPWGTLGPICSKFQRLQDNKWHQPHLQTNKQEFKKTIPITNPNKSFLTLLFTKPRKSDVPSLKKVGSAELPKG